jgi:hypothetical protein
MVFIFKIAFLRLRFRTERQLLPLSCTYNADSSDAYTYVIYNAIHQLIQNYLSLISDIHGSM